MKHAHMRSPRNGRRQVPLLDVVIVLCANLAAIGLLAGPLIAMAMRS